MMERWTIGKYAKIDVDCCGESKAEERMYA